MKRLSAALSADFRVQARNQLVLISVVMALLLAPALAWLVTPDNASGVATMSILFIVGGSTLMYVVAMMILEREDGVLDALVVSPLRSGEYIAAKVVSLTALALLEGCLMLGLGLSKTLQVLEFSWLSGLWTTLGLILLGVIHVLSGVILVVRYRRLMAALLPMGGLAVLFQVPAFYFLGAVQHPLILVIPSAPPAMFIKAALSPLETWEWLYASTASIAIIALLAWWARSAFERHILRGGLKQ